jgi:hypothetical protein
VRAWLAFAAALALVAGGCAGDDDDAPAAPQGRFIAATRSMSPPVHLFADHVVVRIEVVVDRDHLDPDRVRLDARFPPYERVGAVDVDRRDFDRFTRLRYGVTLRCLTLNCLPQGAASQLESIRPERVRRFKPAHVYYDDPETGRPRHLKRIWWSQLVGLSRIGATDPRFSQQFTTPFQTTLAPLPSLTYRISPSLLAGVLFLAAALLLVLPARLSWSWLRRRRPPPPVEEPERTPLERALALVEWARESVDGEDRRNALEVLAYELDASGRAGQAEAARRLAWSPSAPSPEAAGELVASVKESDAA